MGRGFTARLALAGLLVAPGCGAVGLIYTHTTEPLDLNLNRTPIFAERAEAGASDVKSVRYYVSVDWNSNAIGDIARENGLHTVYYADLEVLSVLFGLWRQATVHVYGE